MTQKDVEEEEGEEDRERKIQKHRQGDPGRKEKRENDKKTITETKKQNGSIAMRLTNEL